MLMSLPSRPQAGRGTPCRVPGRARGFTLIELMITLALLSLVLKLAAPAFGLWTRNTQVRALGEAVKNGVRVAQGEALRRNRQVVFFLTDSQDCSTSTAATANGHFWAARTVALTAGDAVQMVQCGVLSEMTAGAGIAGPTAICFNSAGRQTANAAPGLGSVACTLDATGFSTYNVSATGADRPRRVLVSLGGQVRMCDPARTQSATMPDGCPAP